MKDSGTGGVPDAMEVSNGGMNNAKVVAWLGMCDSIIRILVYTVYIRYIYAIRSV